MPANYLFRRLRDFRFLNKVLMNFYISPINSITTWMGNFTKQDLTVHERVVSERSIRTTLLSPAGLLHKTLLQIKFVFES